MRIVIASDLHGSLPALRFLLGKVNQLKPDMLVLLGDLVYHGPRNPLPEGYDTLTLVEEIPELAGLPCPVTAVRGNCDSEVDIGLLPFPVTDSAWLACDGLRIFASHGHRLPEHYPISGFPPGTVFLRGHTHIPRGQTEADIHFWNPGSLSLPKGGSPRTFGFYENGVFKVFDTNDNEVLRHSPKNTGQNA